ncbi:uncharacterized protein TNCV_1963961 [Trichonephila clavipes]|nr:uncharacterized protein TNCV_1963961 [Trichonephila clavipes]
MQTLHRLKKKGAKFNWSTEAHDSFEKIKRALTEAPVFQLPNFTEQFNLFTDASGFGIGAVLNQNHRPIAFASRTINKAELNYTVTVRESTRGLLATDHVILNHGQVTWTTPELAPPLLTTTPHQREDVSALDRFNVYRCPTRRVFSGTGFELMTCLPRLDTLTTGLPQPRRKPIGHLDRSQISCAALRALALNSREQLIREKREDPELGHISIVI